MLLKKIIKMTKKNQKTIFRKTEANKWYLRNYSKKKNFIGKSTLLLADWLYPHRKTIKNIFEVGCSDGRVLDYLSRSLDAKGFGIDPSKKAISAGSKKYKKNSLKLKLGTSDKLFVKDSSMDLVHFGFCLVWVERKDYFKSIAEADRICKTGGFISILDFDSTNNQKVKYHHKKGLFSYKTDNSSMFLANNHYSIVNVYSLTNDNFYFDTNLKNRVKLTLLYKEKDSYLKF